MTMKLLILFSIVILVTKTQADSHKWQQFKLEYGKTYKNILEEKQRFAIFVQNLKTIDQHNEQFQKGKTTYRMGINTFSDWTEKEISDFLKVPEKKAPNKENIISSNKPLKEIKPPTSFDWRDKNVVTEVKNQIDCSSGWAFGAAAALESIVYFFTKKLRSVSVQELIDCVATKYSDDGCFYFRGSLADAYDYFIEKGFAYEDEYPYTSGDGTVGTCKTNYSDALREYKVIGEGDEKTLLETVAFEAPVAVLINVTPEVMQYTGGILGPESGCQSYSPNHGAAVIGYGTENGTDYWILKNSYGPNWGEKGFFRIKRGLNLCGVASYAVAPIYRC